jgi:hypothetical protein
MTRTKKQSTEAAVREIRRKTRRKFAPEEKVRIVLEGLRGEQSISELCRREGSVALAVLEPAGFATLIPSTTNFPLKTPRSMLSIATTAPIFFSAIQGIADSSAIGRLARIAPSSASVSQIHRSRRARRSVDLRVESDSGWTKLRVLGRSTIQTRDY